MCVVRAPSVPHMVEEFGWGQFTPQHVQLLAELAQKDIKNNADMSLLEDLASVGAYGNCPKNASRDLTRTLSESRLPTPKYHRIPIRHKLLGRGRPKLPFLYPHEMVASLFHHYPRTFYRCVAPPGEAERFWDEVSGGSGLQTSHGDTSHSNANNIFIEHAFFITWMAHSESLQNLAQARPIYTDSCGACPTRWMALQRPLRAAPRGSPALVHPHHHSW